MDDYRVGTSPDPQAQQIRVVHEAGPGVEVATWSEDGASATIVREGGPGVRDVYFENGVPPSALDYHVYNEVHGGEQDHRGEQEHMDACFMLLL